MNGEQTQIAYNKHEDMKPDLSDVYRQIDGLRLPIDVYLPKVTNRNNRIAVVCIHGGGWTTGITEGKTWTGGDMRHQARYFSMLGYVGIAISYRALHLPDTDILELLEDCKAAMRRIKGHYAFLDPERIVLLGDSAGAHLATCLGIGADDSERPKIVVACNPVLDCTERFSYASASAEHRESASPIKQRPNACAQFLIMHGDADQTTPLQDSVAFDAKLKKLGFDSELVVLHDVAHAFILYDYRSTDAEVLQYMQIIHNYLQRKLFPTEEKNGLSGKKG